MRESYEGRGAQESPLGEVWRGLEAADYTERGEQGREGCDDGLDDGLKPLLVFEHSF